MMKLNEKQIIQLFIAKLKQNNLKDFGKNDVTVIPPERLAAISLSHAVVFKCDMLVESTDVPAGMKPWQIARKSIVACVSDLSAKGVKPPYICVISIGLPTKYSKSE